MEAIVEPARNRTSWGAIFAGVVVAIATQILLVLLGFAIGLTAIDPQSQNPFAGIGIGSLVWLALTALLSLFAGGYVAGRLSSAVRKGDGFLNGAVVWALFLIFSIFVTGQGIAGLVGGVGSAVKGGASSAADSGVVEDIISRSGLTEEPRSPQAEQRAEEAQQPQEGLGSDDAVDILARQTGLSREEAANLMARGQERLGSVNEQEARGVGASVATYSSAAFWGLFALFTLMLIASAVGGSVGVGAKRPEVVSA
jgi:uncharacterized protein YidB (DUF937 family)